MKPKKSLSLSYELKKIREGSPYVIGCDEVGRGCLAGPVVAAAVSLCGLPGMCDPELLKAGIYDSKLIPPARRTELSGLICAGALWWGVGIVDHEAIDEINIHHASLLAMRRAVENLWEKVSSETQKSSSEIFFNDDMRANRNLKNSSVILVDGKFIIPEFDMKQEAIIGGDAKILSIAAASVVAKVYRDELMPELDSQYPGYGFVTHKGYATLHHREAIKKFGLTPIHRSSFCGKYL